MFNSDSSISPLLNSGDPNDKLVLKKQELLATTVCLEASAVYCYFGKLSMFTCFFSAYNLF